MLSVDTENSVLDQLVPGLVNNINEPAHDKIYNLTCVTSKDSDQPVYPPSTARALIYPSLDSLEAVEGTCDQQRL